jgi:quinol-cytochrome oxidoreductase complex cytochrome b subunit
MKKSYVQAFGVGLIFVIVFYAFQIVRGMYLTMNKVPAIIDSYESVDHLQQKVSFGFVTGPSVIEFLGVMLLGIIVFYLGRALSQKRKSH